MTRPPLDTPFRHQMREALSRCRAESPERPEPTPVFRLDGPGGLDEMVLAPDDNTDPEEG